MAKGRKTGGGSRRGIPNRFTATAKQAFDYAFQEIGGEQALADWARRNRSDFYRLFARQIAQQHGEAAGRLIDLTPERQRSLSSEEAYTYVLHGTLPRDQERALVRRLQDEASVVTVESDQEPD